MAIDPEEKMIKKSEGRMEKYIIRKAFDTPGIRDSNYSTDVVRKTVFA